MTRISLRRNYRQKGRGLSLLGLGTATLLGLMCLLPAGRALAGGISVVSSLAWTADLQPGGQAQGKILIHNGSNKAGDVRIYQTDYQFTADGKNDFGDPGTCPRSNAAWITVKPAQLTVAPGQTATAYYNVSVPNNPKLTGTYWSLIMVEPMAPPPPAIGKGKPQLYLRTVLRYAIQIATNIGDTGKRNLRFSNRKLVTNGASRYLQLDIENTGQRVLIPLLWAQLYDKTGASAGRFEGKRRRLYPGCSARFHIDLTSVPPGDYTAMVVADNGDAYVFGARYTLDVGALSARAPAVTPTAAH